MLARIKAPLAKLSNYPRLRILLIIAVVIIVFIVLMNLLSPKNNTNAPPSAVQAVSAQKNKPAKPVSPEAVNQYNKLQAANQKQELQKAVSTGGTIFENSFNNNQASAQPATNQAGTTAPSTSTSGTEAPAAATTSAPASPQPQATTNNPELQRQLDSLQHQLQQQTTQNAEVTQVEGNMRSAVTSLTSSWAIPTAATVQSAAPATPASNGAATTGPVMIKAGTILFGIINTALDSDQPGTPVMATIVTGPYKGAKLLGAFQAVNGALVVQFNTMSLTTLNRTIGINAYALDQNTANNAIATSVDNHYLLRYGMLFASAFLQGFGNAYQNYNYTCPPGTANCTLINSNGTPNTQATTKTAAYQGLGQIGTTLGQVAAQQFNTPPTIKVDQGTGIGVLFMSDVSLPAN